MKALHHAVTLALACMLLSTPAVASHYSLSDVNVVPSKHVTTLYKMGITSTRTLLERLHTRKARRALAKTLGVKAKVVDAWANTCDLLRIKGVGPIMARLFTAAKVNTIKLMAKQVPATLMVKIIAANKTAKVTDNLPSEGHLQDWIGQAKRLPIVVKH